MTHKVAPLPKDEKERLAALLEYQVLDTLPEQSFDDITSIAAHICGVPISLVSLIDSDRQWFKSHHGLDATETPRSLAFCAHAILNPDEVFQVPDSLQDERFSENPLATGAPHVRFYAGAPLVTPNGKALGTLCVIDHEPRTLNDEQKSALQALSRQTVAQLELRKKLRELEQSKHELVEAHEDLKTFTNVLSHDLRSPIRNLVTISQWLNRDCKEQLNEQAQEFVNLLEEQSKKILELMDGLKEFVSSARHNSKPTSIELASFVKEVRDQVDNNQNLKVVMDGELGTVQANRAALNQIFLNLFSNANKYCDKQEALVTVSTVVEAGKTVINVSDNGPGIDQKFHTKIFEIFESLHTHDRYGSPTTGMGLTIVKRLVNKLGGEISIDSHPGSGTTFTIELPQENK